MKGGVIGLLEKLKRILASTFKIPNTKSVPTDRYGSNLFYNKTKSTLPKNPSYKQLREFAKNPIVSQPIEAVKDRIAKMKYEIKPKIAIRSNL
jgi:hypothetical protein